MKYRRLLLTGIILLVIALSASLKAQQNKALLYMEKINREMNPIMVDTWDYTSEVAHGKSARRVETKRKELIRTSKLALDKVSKMDAYEGSFQYRDSVVSFLRINYIVLNQDYEKILNMEDIAEQSYDLMEAYLLAQELAGEKLDSASDRMEEQERLFAANNTINLVENKDKVAKKLEKAGGVIKHYHVVYLIFFKCYKQEYYLIDAMNKKDFSAMEQNKNSLIAFSATGLEKLKSQASFKNDKSLIWAVKVALDFYHIESSVKIAKIIDFYMQQERFEKIKASFNAKPQSGRTKEDVNQYNATITEYNNQLNSFNKLNAELTKRRKEIINDWNISAKNFMDKHVPRYK